VSDEVRTCMNCGRPLGDRVEEEESGPAPAGAVPRVVSTYGYGPARTRTASSSRPTYTGSNWQTGLIGESCRSGYMVAHRR
jgi:hypothetical protein